MKTSYVLIAIITFIFILPSFTLGADVPIIPKPFKAESSKGSFVLSSTTRIMAVGESVSLNNIARYTSNRINEETGISLKIKHTAKAARYNDAIILQLNGGDTSITDEGYRLVVSPQRIRIVSRTESGVFYGVQSLLQLCAKKRKSVNIPALNIEDKPRFTWRGLHLDVSRHFFSKEFIKKYIDILALHKMNTFHWHLTDDQGWRL